MLKNRYLKPVLKISAINMEGIILIISILTQTLSHPEDATFRHTVCQQFNSWCSTQSHTTNDYHNVRVGKAGPIGPVGPRGLPGVVNMTAVEEMVDRKITAALVMFKRKKCEDVDMSSASSYDKNGGVYDIFLPVVGLTEVYCDVATDGGNWIVFQRRKDGTVDFYRGWEDYVNGFGDPIGEFWLGLEALHQLTKKFNHELRIDMEERNGTRLYAKYENFKIGRAEDKYRLRVSGYSGNATDSFANPPNSGAINDNQQFSTKDADHDRSSGRNCASPSQHDGAWWHNRCTYSNLNGVYNNEVNFRTPSWYDNGGHRWMIMKFVEMKIRPKKVHTEK